MITNIIPYDPEKYYYNAIDLPLAKFAWTPVETSDKRFLYTYRIAFIAPIIIMATGDFIIGNMLRMTFGNFFLYCENNLTKKVKTRKSWLQKHLVALISIGIISVSIASVYITVKHPSIFDNLLKSGKITKPQVVISKSKIPWIKLSQKIIIFGIALGFSRIYIDIYQVILKEKKKKTISTDQAKSLLKNPWWQHAYTRGLKMKEERDQLADQ